jgi:hypothetical protein
MFPMHACRRGQASQPQPAVPGGFVSKLAGFLWDKSDGPMGILLKRGRSGERTDYE